MQLTVHQYLKNGLVHEFRCTVKSRYNIRGDYQDIRKLVEACRVIECSARIVQTTAKM